MHAQIACRYDPRYDPSIGNGVGGNRYGVGGYDSMGYGVGGGVGGGGGGVGGSMPSMSASGSDYGYQSQGRLSRASSFSSNFSQTALPQTNGAQGDGRYPQVRQPARVEQVCDAACIQKRVCGGRVARCRF